MAESVTEWLITCVTLLFLYLYGKGVNNWNYHFPALFIYFQNRIIKRIESFTTLSAQLCENQEIFSEQIEIGMIQPLKIFINTQLAPVNLMRADYHGVCRRLVVLQERFAQFKRHELAQMGELSYHLFDLKIHKHQVNSYVL